MKSILLEHLENIEGVEWINSTEGYDCYHITTYAGAQHFLDYTNRTNQLAGATHFQNEGSFNANIGPGHNLQAYFITHGENSNVAVLAILVQAGYHQDYNGVTLNNCAIEDFGHANIAPNIIMVLIPEITIVEQNAPEVTNDTQAQAETKQSNAETVDSQTEAEPEEPEIQLSNKDKFEQAINKKKIKVFDFMSGDVPCVFHAIKQKDKLKVIHVNSKIFKEYSFYRIGLYTDCIVISFINADGTTQNVQTTVLKFPKSINLIGIKKPLSLDDNIVNSINWRNYTRSW